MNLTINRKKMFLPLKKVKGSAEQRLQRARELNLQFYDNLQKEFVDGKVTPGKFRSVLSHTAGKRLNIILENSFFSRTPLFSHACHTKKKSGIFQAYSMTIPRTDTLTDLIDRNSAPTFLKATQGFFNEILNPKFFTRGVALMVKSKAAQAQGIFYEKNIAGKNKLSEKRLDNLLKRTPQKNKIDMLQFFRYSLLSEKNTKEAEPQIDQSIAKSVKMTIINRRYNLEDYKYDEKLALLNKKLAELLAEERAKIAAKYSSKA